MFRRRSSKRKRRQAHNQMQSLEARQLLTAVSAMTIVPDLAFDASGRNGGGNTPQVTYYTDPTGYSPAQIEEAYGFNQVNLNGVTARGAGSTIAIVDAYNDPKIAADLSTFDTNFGLSAPASFTQISETGGPTSSLSTDSGWDLETSLDVEWAHAIAPAAGIVLVEANSDSLSDLVAAVNEARSYKNVDVVSMSWGSGEFNGETAYTSDFTTPAGHNNETFVAASGDSGAFGGAQWPASSPNVVAVGGTTLDALNSTGAYGTESAWSDSSGGASSFIGEPSYQDPAQSTGRRVIPDVAYDANPNTGFAVYDSTSYDGVKGWQEIGGTSAGSPQWAALIAIADQERVADGMSTLDGISETLPALYSVYSAPNTTAYAIYAKDFHDVGSPGFDTATGLGSPNAPLIVQALVGATPTTVTVPAIKTTSRNSWRGGRYVNSPAQGDGGAAGQAPSQPAPAPAQPVSAPSQSVPPPLQYAQAPSQPAAQAMVATSELTQSAGAGSLVTVSAAPYTVATQYTVAKAAVASRSFSGTVWTEIQRDFRADVAAATSVLDASAAAGARAIKLVQVRVAQAAAATAAPMEAITDSHVWLQLANLDASVFADTMRVFAHESAALGAEPGSGWTHAISYAAAAVLADAILVGYWYIGAARRKAKAAEATGEPLTASAT